MVNVRLLGSKVLRHMETHQRRLHAHESGRPLHRRIHAQLGRRGQNLLVRGSDQLALQR